MDTVGAHSFSTVFPTASDHLSHSLILSALQNIDTSTMSNGEASEFIDWLNYNSPISPMNIDQTLASFTPHYQYSPQPLPDVFMPATSYPPPLPSSPLMEPPLNFPQQFNNIGFIPTYDPSQLYAYVPSPITYHGPVGQPPFGFPQQFNNNGYIPTYNPTQQYDDYVLFSVVDHGPVGYVDEAAIIYMVDETSEYEDMLDLQQRIGHVNVGLSEKTISMNLKTSGRSAASDVKQEEEEEEGEVCAVCQDEYKVNETIGTLECGHRYHANCIKQWLLQKNVCPICKATALVI